MYNLSSTPAVQAAPLAQMVGLIQKRAGLAIAMTVLAGAVLELVPPLLMQRIVDDYLAIGRAEGLLPLALLYLAASGGVQALSFASSYLTALSAQSALHTLRRRLFAHLQQLPMPYYDQTPLGDLISRCTADVETVDTLFSTGTAGLLADAVRLVSVVAAMIAISPLLSLVAALAVPPLWWVTHFFRLRVRSAERVNRRAVGRLHTHLQETLGGVEVIRTFGRAAVFIHRFRLALSDALAAFNQTAVYTALYTPMMAVLSALVVALLLWIGALNGPGAWRISPGTLIAFVLLFRRFFTPIINLGDEWQAVQGALSGAERIFQVLLVPVEAQVPTSPIDPPGDSRAAALELHQVTFGYLDRQPVLHTLSLRVRPGEQVALVGRTGAGKTSVMQLLAGMYAPWSGWVRVSGRDPRQIPDSQRRRLVGVVPQGVHLFSGTILDNLTLGDSSVTRAEVERAAAIAGAAGFIRALPQGYDTPLTSDAGSRLSAGQRQALALARALVWDPPVLMLDEATALIDSAAEHAFRNALRAGTTRAVLIIAHRLATARDADRVIVLEAGRVLEAGPPADLIARGGQFAALLELEAAGWDWRSTA